MSIFALDSNKKERFIIDALDKRKEAWDLIMLLFAIFNSFAVPLEFILTALQESNYYAAVDLAINLLFFIDIVLGFMTTNFDAQGQEVRDHKLIAKKYLRGLFIIDFLSSIPYKQLFPTIKSIQILKILKIARISRFEPVVQKMELNEESKAVSYTTLDQTRMI